MYGGDGLSRIDSGDGKRKTVFVPLVLPGEKVEATVAEERPGFARARLDRVAIAAPERTSPPCPYFGECGGCHYQHATYESQLRLKTQILHETVARISKLELPEITAHASPPLGYRNRTRMKLRTAPEFSIGYYRLGSHNFLPVQECPISSPAINRVLQTIWSVARTQKFPTELQEIEFFANHEDTAVLLEFVVSKDDNSKLLALAKAIQKEAAEVAGIGVIVRKSATDEPVAAPELSDTVPQASKTLTGETSFKYSVDSYEYRIGVDAFFQTNRFLIGKLVDLATAGISGKLAMDLYAGAGLFTLPLSKGFDRVVAVESSPASVQYLRQNAPPHAKIVEATTEAYVGRGGQKPGYIVVDPPRAGLGKRVVAGIVRLAPRTLTYVSCDPSTLARDLPGLVNAGYKITQAHLVDLFPQTFHIETVLRLER